MKLHHCILCLVITLMYVSHCCCQSSEEQALRSDQSYSGLDRAKPPMDNLNGLLESLTREGNDADTDDRRTPMTMADYGAIESIAARLGYGPDNNDAKRSWSKMNAAWGKRGNNGGRSSGWTRFGGAWGKREPGWNNLKGLWGKRADKWDKLSSAWGKRQPTARAFQ